MWILSLTNLSVAGTMVLARVQSPCLWALDRWESWLGLGGGGLGGGGQAESLFEREEGWLAQDLQEVLLLHLGWAPLEGGGRWEARDGAGVGGLE